MSSRNTPGLVAVSTMVMLGVFALGIGPPVAPIVSVWFVFVVPGLPFVGLLRLREPGTEAVLTVVLSLSIEAIVSIALLWPGWWTGGRALVLTSLVALTGAWILHRSLVEHRSRAGHSSR